MAYPKDQCEGPSNLFLMHISDINYESADSTVSCFADNTRILLGINHEEDTQMLQNDAYKLYKWADTNNMISSMPTSLNLCDMEKNRK